MLLHAHLPKGRALTFTILLRCVSPSAAYERNQRNSAGSLAGITYQLGDVFVSLDSEEAQQMMERAKEQNKARTKVLEEEMRIIKGIMADLKSQLYNKFGNNINLEPDDS
ncbi:hypothetical protein HPB50_008173 [Hyalomma asiaticum]|uniref:Uncharacterized protein n=1 Tax=Hyalomma asiaticum TaxID=266040 RepID=A0ACB7TGD6_HYAAI|nr:hypothetical protein HPB50_008173 [Hyalomma asiaticum]